jgi:FkbM family methyltransferase
LRVAEFLCRPVVGRWVSRVCRGRIPSLRFRGWRGATDAPGVRPGTVASIFWGIYESAEIRFVRRYLRPDLNVVELGASLGVVSAEVSMRQERGRRICVEANPALVPLLRRNVAANSRRGGEIVLNRAVDYSGRGTIRFVRGETSAGGRTAAVSRLLTGAEKWDEVEAVTLSQLLDEFDVGPYALVSDVEGSEAGFISYDAAALAPCRQLMSFMMSPARSSRRASRACGARSSTPTASASAPGAAQSSSSSGTTRERAPRLGRHEVPVGDGCRDSSAGLSTTSTAGASASRASS